VRAHNCEFDTILSQQPSIFGGTVPRESLLNFSEDIPGGRYSSSSGSTESLMTMVAACNQMQLQIMTVLDIKMVN